MGAEERGYRPIGDYGLIGDGHTAALVASDGSIDWLCWPRFDSPAVLCRLLDARKGGWFRVGPARGEYKASRAYTPATCVLTGTFETGAGRFRLTDFMPVEKQGEGRRGEDIAPSHEIIRLVEGLEGVSEVEVSFRPTFDFARGETQLTPHRGGAVAQVGEEALVLSCPYELHFDERGALTGRFRVSAGERVWVALDYFPEARGRDLSPSPKTYDAELERTLRYWREWWSECRYEGPYAELVRRSALTLKLLTYEPTGALVAAPTTSLPEQVGGMRNWDYRFTWLRDSALVLYALQLLGYYDEAADFFGWLDRLCVTCHGKLQIMYTVDGGADIPERTLAHLEGYRRSQPVRVGNAAFDQKQLDIYGEVLDAVHLYHERLKEPVRREWWDEVQFMADQTVARWREPDYGIWEVRGGPRQFLYSKLMCWVALDRAVKLAERSHPREDVRRWEQVREEIRQTILEEGYNREVGAFTQTLGGSALDASALVVPLAGFLPATDPRVVSTAARIQEQLTSGGLVYRYLTDDGLPGGEATFALCSFWLVDNLALQGRVGEARELFERIAGYANDLGLLAEEIDPASGELLGNYPQGFSHLALIRSALNISRAEASGAEERPSVPAERSEETERTVCLSEELT